VSHPPDNRAVSSTDFDFEGVFDEDYLHFYGHFLTAEVSDRQAALIAHLLQLEPGHRVLDVPCGHGRIAQRLAARGCEVVGVDASALFLEHARRAADEAGVRVDYRQADMRETAFESEFDAVVNWFTSFGYFDDETGRAQLKSWRQALKPGGRLLLDHQNRDRILPMIQAGQAHVEQAGDDLMIDISRHDYESERVRTERILVRGGRVRRTVFSVRSFTPKELVDWLLDAGFDDVQAFGAVGERFHPQSARLVLVAST
jgi:SAM-dependent methyltransferase